MAAYRFKRQTKHGTIKVGAGLEKVLLNAAAQPVSSTEIRVQSFNPHDRYEINKSTDTIEIWDGASWEDVTANTTEAICIQLNDEILFKQVGSDTPTLNDVTAEGNTTDKPILYNTSLGNINNVTPSGTDIAVGQNTIILSGDYSARLEGTDQTPTVVELIRTAGTRYAIGSIDDFSYDSGADETTITVAVTEIIGAVFETDEISAISVTVISGDALVTIDEADRRYGATTLEYDELSDFPATGASDVIYIAADTNKIYRWDTVTSSYKPLATQQVNSVTDETEAFAALGNGEFGVFYDETTPAMIMCAKRDNGAEFIVELTPR